MPEFRRYRVREEREILVQATNPSEAVAKASVWFEAGGKGGSDGSPEIRCIDISATED
jgi:hypothetical protein